MPAIALHACSTQVEGTNPSQSVPGEVAKDGDINGDIVLPEDAEDLGSSKCQPIIPARIPLTAARSGKPWTCHMRAATMVGATPVTSQACICDSKALPDGKDCPVAPHERDLEVVTWHGVSSTSAELYHTAETAVPAGRLVTIDGDIIHCTNLFCLRLTQDGSIKWKTPAGTGGSYYLDGHAVVGNSVVVPIHPEPTDYLKQVDGSPDRFAPFGVRAPLGPDAVQRYYQGVTAVGFDVATGHVVDYWGLLAGEGLGTSRNAKDLWAPVWVAARPGPDGTVVLAGQVFYKGDSTGRTGLGPGRGPVLARAGPGGKWLWWRLVQPLTYSYSAHAALPPVLTSEGKTVALFTSTYELGENVDAVHVRRHALWRFATSTGQEEGKATVQGISITPWMACCGIEDANDLRASTTRLADGRIVMTRATHSHQIPADRRGKFLKELSLSHDFLLYDQHLHLVASRQMPKAPGPYATISASSAEVTYQPIVVQSSPCGISVLWDRSILHLDPWGTPVLESGKCLNLNVNDCDDADPCTVDGCEPEQGCTHVALPDGAWCGGSASCQAGLCVAP